MKRTGFLLILACLLAQSCQNQNKVGGNTEKIVVNNSNATTPFVDDIFPEKSIIRLETNADCLLGEVRKVLEYQNKYYVSDRDKICIFYENGDHLYTLSRKGRSREEYTSISDFNILNDQIILLDRNKKSLLFYNLSGQYQGSEEMDFWASSFGIIDNRTIVLNADYENPINKFHVYDVSNSRWESSFYEIPEEKISYMHFTGQNNFSYLDNSVIFNEIMNENILKINKESHGVKYNISFKGHTPPDGFWNTPYKDVREFMTNFTNSGYRSGAGLFMEQNDKILFSFSGSVDANMCLFDKIAKRAIYFSDMVLSENITVPMRDIRITPQYDSSAIIVCPTIYMFDENGNLLSSEWEGLSMDENPILYKINL